MNNPINFLSNTCKINKMAAHWGIPLTLHALTLVYNNRASHYTPENPSLMITRTRLLSPHGNTGKLTYVCIDVCVCAYVYVFMKHTCIVGYMYRYNIYI